MKKKILFLCALIIGCFGVFVGTVKAAEGPADEADLVFILEPDRNVNYSIYHDGTIDNSILSGASYDSETNTLTIKDVKGNYDLVIEYMGDLTINVLGTNELYDIWVDGDSTHKTNVTFTGDGTLIINKNKDENVIPIYSRSGGKLIFENKLSLQLYAAKVADAEYVSVIECQSMSSDDTSSCIIFKGDIKPEVKTYRWYSSSTKFIGNVFGLLPEEYKYYNVATKEDKKYAYEVGGEEVTVYTTELVLDTYSNKLYLGSSDEIMNQKSVYANSDAATAAGYTLSDTDKAYVGYYKNALLFKDSSEKQYALINDNYIFDITDNKITVGSDERTYLMYNPSISLDDLDAVQDIVYEDEWEHYVEGTELIIDRTTKVNNPKTSDSIINYIILLVISSIGIYLFKNKKFI